MPSYGKFQSDNNKYTRKVSRVNTNNPDFTPAIDIVGAETKSALERNLPKWIDIIGWARANPDLWYDLITPETGALIRLDLDQRVELRCLARFPRNYFVKPRGSGKTMTSMMYAIHTAVFYPGVLVPLTAQTRENSAKLIKEKFDELTKAFPLLKEEVYSTIFRNDTSEIEFHNGSKIFNIANAQSSKGAHTQRGIVDEDNLTDEETYLDVLEPIFTTVKRRTVGKECLVDPMELNGAIAQITSSGYRGSPAFYRCLKVFDDMVNLRGAMCLGASWELPCFYGRGATKAEILKKKEANSAISFAMNYEAKWTGCSDNSLVSIAKLMECRNLSKCELKPDGKSDYVIAVDVARSDNDGNNQTSIAVLKAVRKANNRIKEVHLVNLTALKGTLDGEAQTIAVKRMKLLYGDCMVVYDDNGIGKTAIGDNMVKVQTDPITGEDLPCYTVLESVRTPEMPNAPATVFPYMAQKYDNESIAIFMDYVETGKLRLLSKQQMTEYGEEDMPFLQTDFFVEEVSNLQLKHLNNGGLSIDRVVKKMNKDRFSAVQYGLWYIVKYMDNAITETEDDDTALASIAMWF